MATETLYFDESQASENYKLVRISREFRPLSWANNGAHITIAGFLRGGLLEMTEQSRSMIQEQLRTRMAEKREALIRLGVMASDIVMFEPNQYLPTTQHLIVITTEAAPRGITFPAVPYNGGPLRPGTGPHDKGPVQPTRVFEKAQDGTEAVEVEVKVWDAEHRKWVSEGTVSAKIGPNGIVEGSAEITALVQKARAKGHDGRAFEFEFAIKGSAAITAGEKTEWEAKVKKAITIKLPSGVKLEGSVSIDQHGVPGLGLKVVFP
ncbi:MAG: hypothetical protein HY820_21340 [Acidobacteria bacterium]|nr:hypothetical protein [Acidobacteriota bacterium]